MQQVAPKATLTSEGDVALSPVFDMLGVKFVVFRGAPLTNARPAFVSEDYWVLENPSALPRAFVPRRVEAVPDSATRLARLGAPDYKPRQVAYVEKPANLPGDCQGTARITREIPTLVDISVQMKTAGLVVLTDRWDPGWQASFNGTRVPILRVNHALCGVVVPSGAGNLEFRYAPRSFKHGLLLAAAAGLTLLVWGAVLGLRKPSGPASLTLTYR